MLPRKWTHHKLEAEHRARYLPFEIRGWCHEVSISRLAPCAHVYTMKLANLGPDPKGTGVLIKESDSHFRVDNSQLGERAQGVCYRLSKDADNKDFEHIAFWDSVITGEDTGDGWLLCDLDTENLDLLDQLEQESALEALRSKFCGNSMVCCSTSSNVEGRWISMPFQRQKVIDGVSVVDGSFTYMLAWDGLNAFSVMVAGEKRKARLLEDRLIWNDGELWTRDHSEIDALKKTDKWGSDLESANARFHCVCQKGLKPGSLNQDAWSVLRVENEFSLYSVCDGHGPHGPPVRIEK